MYNEADYIGACLQAIAVQTAIPDEVLVVNNNSTDKTAEIARRYSFVRLINEPVQGLVAARNRGFEEAKYELVARVDADARLIPEWVEIAKRYMAENPDIAAISGSAEFYNFRFKRLTSWAHRTVYYRLQRRIAGATILWGGNMLIRRKAAMEIIDECRREEGINEDIYLSLVMKRHGLRTAFCPALLARVSLQRGNFAPAHTIKYLRMWHTNYAALDMPVRASFIFLLKGLVLLFALPGGAVYLLTHRRSG